MIRAAEVNERLAITTDEWARGVAQRISQCLQAGIAARGVAVLAVSGGRSPRPIFQRLREAELAWDKVIVTLVDERWVPDGHADGNASLVRRMLLQGPAEAARFLPWVNDAATPQAGRADCDAALRALPLPFDCVVLGMGEDGHTASLFPDAPELADAIGLNTAALCWPITPPVAAHARMTLTLNALLRESRQLILAISGKAKRGVYERARIRRSEALPVSLVLHQDQCPVDVWIED
ncbi:MAG: 6-phosphogluconolactonase [Burkholderiaceae bacterium]|nr:6-phosphogluconolactonase [Burkholderiaceae bacterium]